MYKTIKHSHMFKKIKLKIEKQYCHHQDIIARAVTMATWIVVRVCESSRAQFL